MLGHAYILINHRPPSFTCQERETSLDLQQGCPPPLQNAVNQNCTVSVVFVLCLILHAENTPFPVSSNTVCLQDKKVSLVSHGLRPGSLQQQQQQQQLPQLLRRIPTHCQVRTCSQSACCICKRNVQSSGCGARSCI